MKKKKATLEDRQEAFREERAAEVAMFQAAAHWYEMRVRGDAVSAREDVMRLARRYSAAVDHRVAVQKRMGY